MDNALSINHLSYTYHSINGETNALEDVSFFVKQGEFISLVGPSGCGKSTLLNMIAGLLPVQQGEILIQEQPLRKSQKTIGYMLQKDHLLGFRTIYKNILLGPEIQKKCNTQVKEKADALLKKYGLYQFKDSYPKELSGGMRQRAALIRTLMIAPDILLLDEPFSALDYQTRLNVSDDICKIIKEEKITAILVTHDLSEAISVSDRILVLSKRPATIKATLPITFSIPTNSPREARTREEFKDYFHLLWKEVEDENENTN
ncbi:MAG: ABC transporter ATP-binding protein [Lachnospiraceae bacterium]|nr:ABC transporter ATP-binding protein [Lachnospiraceae bacterium]